MSEKEYIVTLKAGVDYDAFNAEMVASTGAGDIPNRTVNVENARPLSQRNTHYALTDAEAATLRSDNRVDDVQIPPQDREDIEIGFNAFQGGANWKKNTASGDSTDLNWGLVRCAKGTDVFDGTATITEQFNYTLTGKGVDIVIQDSGLQVDHPEFTDSAGVSRVKQINWYTESGLAGSQNANHYRDYDSHGSHCGGTVAGRTQGWAKDAHIYSVKVSGLEGTGDSGTGISVSDCFDVIKGWHNNKPIDPKTGFKRPTVVNASWGYGGSRSTPTSGVYLGNSWNYADYGSSDNNLWANVGVVPVLGLSRRVNVRVASVDADLQECLDAGIIFCIASGNSYYYIDKASGPHYNDTVSFGGGSQENIFRGSSPFSEDAFIVGNVDYTYTNNLEQKAESSCAGPGVNIFAPGTEIISVGSTDNGGTSALYNTYGGPNSPLDSNYKLMKISGTSMASPQVAGMVACILEANPGMTPAQMKTYIEANAKNDQLNTDKTTPAAYNVNASASGSSAYTMAGTDRNGSVFGSNDSITVQVGDTLTITNNAGASHPLYIKTAGTTGTGDQVTTPAATGQGSYGGNGVQWVPTLPGVFYYQCSNHSAMRGIITVLPEINWDNSDSIWDGTNKYLHSPLWNTEKPFTSNISGKFGI